ncbi:hypothetical protein WLH_02865 [Escherichia coli O25b:H4]|uniref:Uncharacterized protein n=1 Tax=Escherichia coli O25b:H4 TaxID=941280 RepID=A0A192CEJ2_ECO25|nr:hypothetical protein WLH_02865 [Escherichia coli O25b:H4]
MNVFYICIRNKTYKRFIEIIGITDVLLNDN